MIPKRKKWRQAIIWKRESTKAMNAMASGAAVVDSDGGLPGAQIGELLKVGKKI